MFNRFKIKIDGVSRDALFETYRDVKNIDKENKDVLASEIRSILSDSWGSFPDDFIDRHVMNGDKMIMVKIEKEYAGFGVLSFKKIDRKDVYYIEFLAVKKKFQKVKLGPRIFYLILRDHIINSLPNFFYKPIEIMFITPNIKTLSVISKFASFSYPNPYLADEEGKIEPADDLTWEMAKKLIEDSDNPNRKIEREGLVLYGSYTNTPWLIYGPDNAPWINNPKIPKFIKRYMGYYNNEDKELVVRAHITIWSVIKYLISR